MSRVMMAAITAAVISWATAVQAETPAPTVRGDDLAPSQAQVTQPPVPAARQPYRPRWESAYPQQRASRGGRDG